MSLPFVMLTSHFLTLADDLDRLGVEEGDAPSNHETRDHRLPAYHLIRKLRLEDHLLLLLLAELTWFGLLLDEDDRLIFGSRTVAHKQR